MTKPLSLEIVIENAKKVHGSQYDYSLVQYKRNNIKFKIICNNCGNIFLQSYISHVNNKSGCPICCTCAKTVVKKSIQKLKEKLKEKFPKYKFPFIQSEYQNNKSLLTVECAIHGKSKKTANMLLRRKFACAKCGAASRGLDKRNSIDDLVLRMNEIHENKYKYPYIEEEYIGVQNKITMICPIHGKFSMRPLNHLHGSACPKCFSYAKISSGELELLDWISEYTETESSNRKILNGKEIDIYLPEYRIGIEYNGIWFHSEQNGTPKNYHYEKMKLAKEKNVYLLQFWETEFIWQKDIVKSIILSAIGKSPNKIYARKLIVSDTTAKIARKFCVENHIHGFRAGKIYKGLFQNDELMSLLIISSSGEIVRFVNKIYYSIPGSFSKLLSYVPRPLYSFVDRRLFSGSSYKTCGFQYIRATKPNYFYMSKNIRKPESRIKYQKHKLSKLLPIFDESKSEIDNMTDNGYFRIFDCGNKYFELQ